MTAELKKTADSKWSSQCTNLKLLAIRIQNELLFLLRGLMDFQGQGTEHSSLKLQFPST